VEYKLFHGKSPYLSLRSAHKELEKIKKENPDINIQILESDSLDSSKYADTLSSSSLFAQKRILFIKRLYRNKEKDKLTIFTTEYLTNNTSEDVVILWEDQKIRSTTKYLKFFKENKSLEELNTLNKRGFMTWLKEELKDQKLNIDSSVQKLIAENSNYDPERCANELQKYKLSGENITKEYILNTTTNTLEMDIWGLIDSINHGDKKKSISIMENLLKQNNDPHYLLAMLARNLRLLTLTKHLTKQNKSSREIASTLRVPPFTVPSMISTTQQYSDEKIEKMYEKFANLDLQIKTGKIDGQLIILRKQYDYS
jgi:DNA polymerase-3 subunit delta